MAHKTKLFSGVIYDISKSEVLQFVYFIVEIFLFGVVGYEIALGDFWRAIFSLVLGIFVAVLLGEALILKGKNSKESIDG